MAVKVRQRDRKRKGTNLRASLLFDVFDTVIVKACSQAPALCTSLCFGKYSRAYIGLLDSLEGVHYVHDADVGPDDEAQYPEYD